MELLVKIETLNKIILGSYFAFRCRTNVDQMILSIISRMSLVSEVFCFLDRRLLINGREKGKCYQVLDETKDNFL